MMLRSADMILHPFRIIADAMTLPSLLFAARILGHELPDLGFGFGPDPATSLKLRDKRLVAHRQFTKPRWRHFMVGTERTDIGKKIAHGRMF